MLLHINGPNHNSTECNLLHCWLWRFSFLRVRASRGLRESPGEKKGKDYEELSNHHQHLLLETDCFSPGALLSPTLLSDPSSIIQPPPNPLAVGSIRAKLYPIQPRDATRDIHSYFTCHPSLMSRFYWTIGERGGIMVQNLASCPKGSFL
jgi:hypothetical protein